MSHNQRTETRSSLRTRSQQTPLTPNLNNGNHGNSHEQDATDLDIETMVRSASPVTFGRMALQHFADSKDLLETVLNWLPMVLEAEYVNNMQELVNVMENIRETLGRTNGSPQDENDTKNEEVTFCLCSNHF